MDNIITFRPRVPQAHVPGPPAPAETRHLIEEAAQAALDTADSLLAILDHMDGDAEAEDGGDADPSLSASENHHGGQVTWLRGGDADREVEVVEVVLPEVAIEPWPFPWSGRGSVVTAAGVVLLDMVAGR